MFLYFSRMLFSNQTLIFFGQTHSFTDLDLLNVIRDVASGMEYLHSKDYIHIDLVPLNVLVNGQKQCKISDLGLCAYVGYTNGVYFKKVMYDISYN